MSPSAAPLSEISRCFQGVIPSIVATSDARGIPNVTYVSQVFMIDDRHVALSCQFFNKTRRNLDENPHICAELYDPLTFQAWRLRLRFLRSEKSGPLYDGMAMRIQAIASLTGMAGIFRLVAADVCEVLGVEKVEGFLTEPVESRPSDGPSLEGLRTELRGLQWISDRINRAENLEGLLAGTLEALEEYFRFEHTMVMLAEPERERLVAVASRGYGESGVGAELPFGDGPIGTVARERRVLRLTGLNASLRYGRAIRRETLEHEGRSVRPEIPLPGLPDVQSMLIIPLAISGRLVGVLAAESRDPMGFRDWHEAYLEILGNQIALGIDRMAEDDEDEREPAVSMERPKISIVPKARRTLAFYRSDDCVFLDGDYLIRNVPGRILWKLVGEFQQHGRTEFSNRELRLDPGLGLPAVKDNLESRLILLRKRLEEKSPDLRILPTGRGRFSLAVGCELELVEK